MNFRETLGRHLLAIEKREFVEAHRGWFAMPNWTLEVQDQNTPVRTS